MPGRGLCLAWLILGAGLALQVPCVQGAPPERQSEIQKLEPVLWLDARAEAQRRRFPAGPNIQQPLDRWCGSTGTGSTCVAWARGSG